MIAIAAAAIVIEIATEETVTAIATCAVTAREIRAATDVRVATVRVPRMNDPGPRRLEGAVQPERKPDQPTRIDQPPRLEQPPRIDQPPRTDQARGTSLFRIAKMADADGLTLTCRELRMWKSRQTSNTISRPIGLISVAKPLTSALSQITLMVKGCPASIPGWQ